MITIKGISKSYHSTKALQPISLQFKQGHCFGLVGPNGAGKSTLIKILVRIIQSDTGEISLDNQANKHWKKRIGYVPQEICLTETLTAEQNLAFYGGIYQLKGKAMQKRIQEVLSYVGLEDKKKEKVSSFSGGMKRRLNIGCALVHDPQFILLDEPTVGIDPQSREYILGLIQKLKQEGRTIIYSSHYMEEVEKICDEVAFLDKGHLLLNESLDNIVQHHTSPALFVEWKEDYTLENTDHALSNSTPFKNGFKIETENTLQSMEEVLKQTKQNKLTLKKFELMQPSLEEVFFSLTGKELRGLFFK